MLEKNETKSQNVSSTTGHDTTESEKVGVRVRKRKRELEREREKWRESGGECCGAQICLTQIFSHCYHYTCEVVILKQFIFKCKMENNSSLKVMCQSAIIN